MITDNDSLSELSIIVVTWKNDELLGNCLDSLHTACGDSPEIIVIDNAGRSSTKKLAGKYRNVQYVSSPENLGFAGGNNLGLQHCSRKFILLLNNDTVVHEEPFSQMIAYMKARPEVVVTQGKMRLVRRGDVLDSCGISISPHGLVFDEHTGRPMKTTATPSGPVFSAKGACMMIRREVIDELGGVLFYDFFKSFYEEIDFCHRVWISGREVHFVDTPPIDHLQGCTASRFNQRELAIRHLANLYFSRLTVFDGYGIATSLLSFFTVQCLVFVSYLVRLQFDRMGVVASAVRDVIRRRKHILVARKTIVAYRKIPDRELLIRIVTPVSFAKEIRILRAV